jgi:hypothetical protein
MIPLVALDRGCLLCSSARYQLSQLAYTVDKPTTSDGAPYVPGQGCAIARRGVAFGDPEAMSSPAIRNTAVTSHVRAHDPGREDTVNHSASGRQVVRSVFSP